MPIVETVRAELTAAMKSGDARRRTRGALI